MAQCQDIGERTSESGPVNELAASDSSDSPTAAVRPETRPPVPGKANVTAAKPDVRLPPAAQLTTPPFLREHASRVTAGRPAAPSKASPRKPAVSGTRDPKSRFPLLATTLALAAALGGAAGAIAIPAARSVSLGPAFAAPAAESTAQAQAMQNLVAQLSTDVGALRTALEQSSKATSARFDNVTERLDRAERAQVEPAGKLAKIAETLERLDRRAAPSPHATEPQNEVTGSVNIAPPPAPESKTKPTIIEDYVLRKVFDGVALVEGRRGILEVEQGVTLPGAGRVEDIRRQDGRWVVVTTKGLIIPAR